MKVVLWILGIFAGLVIVVTVTGWLLPERHSVTRQATFPATPEAVYEAITDVAAFPEWRSKVTKAETVTKGDSAGFRETGSDGTILYSIVEAVPGRRLVTRIADETLPFGGSWTYELAPSTEGTTLRITEDGEVYNPFFRFMSKYVFGHHSTIDLYLEDLRKRLGSTRRR